MNIPHLLSLEVEYILFDRYQYYLFAQVGAIVSHLL